MVCYSLVTAQSAAALAKSFETLSGMEYLDVRGNEEIGNKVSFFAALRKCTRLKSLNVLYCSITGESVAELINTIAALQKLQDLDVSGNKEIGKKVSFFQGLSRCTQLKEVCCWNCGVTEKCTDWN